MPFTYRRLLSPKHRLTLLTGVSLALLAVTRTLAQDASPSANSPSDLSSFLSTFYTDGENPKPKTTWLQSIAVSSPAYCSSIKGDTTITFAAPGMTTVHALCWQQPAAGDSSPWGHDADVAPGLQLDPNGNASFVFHADQFPNGPINIRIFAKDGGSNQDYCELQLFNQGGVVWNQGIPKTDPPAAKGMKVAFSDDFDGPLSIAKDDSGKYWTHWGGGDGSIWPFTNFESPLNPFSQVKGQVKNYLRIHASKPEGTKGATGTLTPMHPDHTGFSAKAPCYFECRFLAQNAKGTWPAFWLLTYGPPGSKGTDELDGVEAYGINSKTGGVWTGYHCTTHFWGQTPPAWVKDKSVKGPDGNPYDAHKLVTPMLLGGKSSWSTTFHTYGVLITPESTAYYLDDIEVLRHPSGALSATLPISFLVNLAIGGGGWKPDLSRYGNQSDMWVDYVRVYQGDSAAGPTNP
jgi:Glycosyl hydrolases family 16